jgi:CRISPR-associated endonuclease/helicase Cas3
MVIATTADQLGSRLLFRGYGVSSAMQPIHAALTACDSTILLDEAHVTRAFSQTLDAVASYRKLDTTAPPMHFVQMTATPTGVDDSQCFRMEPAQDLKPGSELARRQNAPKQAELVFLGKAKPQAIVGAFADRAIRALTHQHKAIGVIVNRVQSARDIHAELLKRVEEKELDADVHLVIGRMRPIDRDVLTNSLRSIVGPDREVTLAKPCVVVATQCLEVGADYDFDVLITDCAAIDALRQRFGRLNRKGRAIDAVAVIIATADSLKADDPVYGNALKNTWEWLTEGERESVDFGITAFQSLWDALPQDRRDMLISPAYDAATLLPAHLDALCQTAPQPLPSPDVSFFIHGPQREEADVQVCWRADLGDDPTHWAEIVSMLPPTSTECMTVPIRALRNWIENKPQPKADADAPMKSDEQDDESAPTPRRVLIWRGTKESKCTTEPREIRPGDTIVIRTGDGGWNILGHIPGTPGEIDVAEQAIAIARRQCIIRIHEDLPSAPLLNDVAALSRALRRSELLGLLKRRFSPEFFNGSPWMSPEDIRSLAKSRARIDQIEYPANGRCGLVIRFSATLSHDDGLGPPSVGEDDDDDSPSEIGEVVSLAEHTRHVVDELTNAVKPLHLADFEECLSRAARFHDLGKADVRFQAMLLASTPEEAALRPMKLGKSSQRNLSMAERRLQRDQAKLPTGFRHEMLSTQMIQSCQSQFPAGSINLDLLLHVVDAHHGHARPFAPVVIDEGSDDLLNVEFDGYMLSAIERRQLPPHRLDSGVADRFWKLTRRHGWWGLAFLESVLRLADQQASEMEQNGKEEQ